jgi:hypothetical protein
MASPFFSGRIPQELYDRVDQHIKESGEGKTQILINALSQYLGIEISKPKSSGVNTDLFFSELESLKERVSLLERSQSQQAIEPVKIAEIPHKQMSLLDQTSDNNDNSLDNAVAVESTDNIIDNSIVINEQILTTKEVEELTGITRRQLDRIKVKGVYPINAENYVIVGYAGKEKEARHSNLWVVKTLDNN